MDGNWYLVKGARKMTPFEYVTVKPNNAATHKQLYSIISGPAQLLPNQIGQS